jgi:hypothetical protein
MSSPDSLARNRSNPLMSFPLFPKLPREIRLLIWEFAVPGPRIVPLVQRVVKAVEEEWNRILDDDSCKPEYGSDDGGLMYINEKAEYGDYYNLRGFQSDIPAPSILFVNCEAYNVASKHYTKTFSIVQPNSHGKYDEDHTTLPETWFDYENDILFLDFFTTFRNFLASHMFLVDFLSEEALKVQNLAITVDHNWLLEFEHLETFLGGMLVRFAKLKNLYVVIGKVGMERSMEGPISKCKDYTPKENSDLVFLDALINLEHAFNIYDSKREFLDDTEIEIIHANEKKDLFKVKLDKLELLRKERIDHGYSAWDMPNIERKILMTREFKAGLMKKRRMYHSTLRGIQERNGWPQDPELYFDEDDLEPREWEAFGDESTSDHAHSHWPYFSNIEYVYI